MEVHSKQRVDTIRSLPTLKLGIQVFVTSLKAMQPQELSHHAFSNLIRLPENVLG